MTVGSLNPADAAGPVQSTRSSGTLKEELEQLSAKYGILIEGLEKTSHSPAPPAQGLPRQQLEKLLIHFNYVLIRSSDKAIDKVIILSQKNGPTPLPKRILLTTRQLGNQHVIHVTAIGPKPARIEVPLLVDTGASLVVLPASLIAKLGFTPADLTIRRVQTANGVMKARVGRLPAIKMGTAVIRNVETAFIKDSLLSGMGLLGMNVLGQYRITINDAQNLISLIKQP